jgi:hypothetical protein
MRRQPCSHVSTSTSADADMNESRPPSHIRRARFAKRVQLLLAIAAAVFAIYRLAALLTGKSSPLH